VDDAGAIFRADNGFFTTLRDQSVTLRLIAASQAQ
jgi:hypothetical protein